MGERYQLVEDVRLHRVLLRAGRWRLHLIGQPQGIIAFGISMNLWRSIGLNFGPLLLYVERAGSPAPGGTV